MKPYYEKNKEKLQTVVCDWCRGLSGEEKLKNKKNIICKKLVLKYV